MTRKERKKAAAAARKMAATCQGPVPTETQSNAAPTPPAQTVAPPTTEPHSLVPDDLRQTYLQKFQPADVVERNLVEEMISAQWRQDCISRIEQQAMAQMMSASGSDLCAAFENQAKLLASLDRAHKAYALQFSRALATLLKMRASLKPAKAAPAQEPALRPAALQAAAASEPHPAPHATAELETCTFAQPAPSHRPIPSPAAESHNRPHLE